MIKIIEALCTRIARLYPSLTNKLRIAAMPLLPAQFVKKTLTSALLMSSLIVFILFLLFSKNKTALAISFLSSPLIFFMMFNYFIRLPDVKILKIKKNIENEIIFAGRFLIIELSSGVLLYDAMKNVAKSYKEIGKPFQNIINSIDLGTPIEEAINQGIEFSSSDDLKKILWQILNALSTGSDISESLKSAIDQITREQMIEIKNYAKKLNPLSMFYMVIAVILPSLGITMLIIMSSFVSIELGLGVLIAIAVLIGLLQYMFFTIIKSARPAVSM